MTITDMEAWTIPLIARARTHTHTYGSAQSARYPIVTNDFYLWESCTSVILIKSQNALTTDNDVLFKMV
jgi:hypothetical protein